PRRLGGPIGYVIDLLAAVPSIVYGVGEGADLVPESGADWAETHGVTPDGAVLVRPDGFVAWRHDGRPANPAGALRDAVAALLSRV
ncbi:hypothetical protein AB0K70_26315, partial [Streptomyces werraensis]